MIPLPTTIHVTLAALEGVPHIVDRVRPQAMIGRVRAEAAPSA